MRRLAILLLCASCGTGGAQGGPPMDPPFSGAAGYDTGDTVIGEFGADLNDPSLVTDSPHGPFAIWLTHNGTEIWRVDLAHLGTDASPLRPALAASEPWEQGSVAKPSVERDASGYHMAYEAAGGLIALADSSDGEHWTGKRMIGPGHAPSLVQGVVFYDDGNDIWRAPVGPAPPLHVLAGTNADVHVRQTTGERPLWQMFFSCTGRDQISVAICYAGSYDGANFASTYVPVLQPDAPSETGPTSFVGSDAAILFFGRTPSGGSMSRIAAATAP